MKKSDVAIFLAGAVVLVAGVVLLASPRPSPEPSLGDDAQFYSVLADETDSAADASLDGSVSVDLPKNLQQIDPNVPLAPVPGYLLVNSVVSNAGDRIVYAEISDCIGLANNYKDDPEECNWDYQIWVKDLKTGETRDVYNYPPRDFSFQKKLRDRFVRPANAGGCVMIPFPFAWSKNDRKILLEYGNPTSCGSGGGIKYAIVTLSPEGGTLEDISNDTSLFLGDYSKVIFVEESTKSPRECEPGIQANYGKIVLRDVETGEIKTLVEESNSSYSALAVDADETVLTYSVQKVRSADACSEIDPSVPEKTEEIQLTGHF